MRLGFSLPLHGSAARPEGLITVAKRAEALGYESLWVWERLLAPVNPKAPYPIGDGTHPALFRSVLDPLEALTFVAGHTERVALGTSVLVLPLYNPIRPRAPAHDAGRSLEGTAPGRSGRRVEYR